MENRSNRESYTLFNFKVKEARIQLQIDFPLLRYANLELEMIMFNENISYLKICVFIYQVDETNDQCRSNNQITVTLEITTKM